MSPTAASASASLFPVHKLARRHRKRAPVRWPGRGANPARPGSETACTALLLTSGPYCDILQHIPIYYQYREPQYVDTETQVGDASR
jgi:hypothetical protein